MTLFPVRDLKLMSEAEYQKAIIKSCTKAGYLVNRVYKMKTNRGAWLTSTTLVGLPDLMAIGRGHTLWIEVKTANGPVSAEQLLLLDRFADIDSNRCWLVRPTDDLQLLANWIARPADAPRRFGFDDAMLVAAQINSTGKTTKKVT